MPASISRTKATLLAGLLAMTPLTLPASAATQEEVLAACLAIAGTESTELCTCKAEQAAKLADAEMLDFIIARMNDPQKFSAMIAAGDVPEDVIAKWPFYVRDSNAVCLAEASDG